MPEVKYLVIHRRDDAPVCDMLTEKELLKQLVEEWKGYTFLKGPPDYERMPRRYERPCYGDGCRQDCGNG